MLKKSFLLIVSLFLTTIAIQADTQGHDIKKLNVTTNPANPRIGDTITLDATFVLQSGSGFDSGRFRAFFGGTNGKALAGSYTFDNLDVNNKKANVSFTGATNFQISKDKTTVLFQYGLTRTNNSPPQAEESIVITAGPQQAGQGNNNGGNGGNGGGGGTVGDTNGNPIEIPQVIFLDIEEANTDNIGMVSDNGKIFRFIVSHDQDFVSFVSGNGSLFDPILNPVLKRLVVKSKDLETLNGSIVTADFIFTPEKDSIADPIRDNYLQTSYLSEPIVLKDTQRLNFSVDLTKFLEKSGTTLPDNLITKDNVKYKIAPLTIPLTNLSFGSTKLNFQQDLVNAKKGKQLLILEGETLSGTLNTEIDLTTSVVSSSVFKTHKKKSHVRLTNKPSVRQNMTVELDGDPVFTSTSSNGDYSITIPIKSSINTSKKTFVKTKRALNISSKDKSVIIPIKINLDSSSGLDLLIEGELNEAINLDFETLDEAGAI